MKTVGIREARHRLSNLIEEEVAKGREITVTNHGRVVAVIGPPKPVKKVPFPDYAAFRKRMKYTGEPPSQTLIRMRREEYR